MNILKWYVEHLQGQQRGARKTPIQAAANVVEYTKKLIPPTEFNVIADVGSADGVIPALLSKYYTRVFAVDFQTMPHGNYTGVIGDMHELAGILMEMDAILMNHTFEHSYSPFILCCEVFCTLREGGRWLINLPKHNGQHAGPHWEHPISLDPVYLCLLFNATGFKILDKDTENQPFWDYWFLLERQPIDILAPEMKHVILERMKNLEYDDYA